MAQLTIIPHHHGYKYPGSPLICGHFITSPTTADWSRLVYIQSSDNFALVFWMIPVTIIFPMPQGFPGSRSQVSSDSPLPAFSSGFRSLLGAPRPSSLSKNNKLGYIHSQQSMLASGSRPHHALHHKNQVLALCSNDGMLGKKKLIRTLCLQYTCDVSSD